MWPRTLDLTAEECRIMLRKLELDTYSNVISSFRAQGILDQRKLKVLSELRSIFQIDSDRHRSETRRATNDEELVTIAKSLFGDDACEQWTREGKRGAPLLYRAKPYTSLTVTADQASEWIQRINKLLPEPCSVLRPSNGEEKQQPRNLIVVDPEHSSVTKRPISLKYHQIYDTDRNVFDTNEIGHDRKHLEATLSQRLVKKGRVVPKAPSKILEAPPLPRTTNPRKRREKMVKKSPSVPMNKKRCLVLENDNLDSGWSRVSGLEKRYEIIKPALAVPVYTGKKTPSQNKTQSIDGRKLKKNQRIPTQYSKGMVKEPSKHQIFEEKNLFPNDDYIENEPLGESKLKTILLRPPKPMNPAFNFNPMIPAQIVESDMILENEPEEADYTVNSGEQISIDFDNITTIIVEEDRHGHGHIEVEELKTVDGENVIEFNDDQKRIIYDPNDSNELIEEEEYSIVHENEDYVVDDDNNVQIYEAENSDFVVDSANSPEEWDKDTDFEHLLDTVNQEEVRNGHRRISQGSFTNVT